MNKIKDKIEMLMESDTIPNILIFIALIATVMNLLVFAYLILLIYT